ncbi:MAG: hypothetical protein JSS34_08170 [Proteobacteria bacterium]|nr:hypothetical protein [Pseudomonadota bacterium]
MYQKLLRKMLDLPNMEEGIGLFNAHCHDFVEKFGLKSPSAFQKKASPEEHLSKDMFPLIYRLLSHPQSQPDSFLWAFYFGFDVNYKPHEAQSLLENVGCRDEKGLLALVLKERVNHPDYLILFP